MNMGQFRSLVQQATGVKHTHRYRLLDQAIPESTTTAFVLMTVDDDPDYDEDFSSSTAPECETGSRILGIDLSLDIVPSAAGEQVEWIICKNPDVIFTDAAVLPSLLFTNDLTSTTILMRKYAFAYGRFLSTSSRESSRTSVRISRAALRRAGVMHDNDKLLLNFTHTTAASPGSFSLHGRIWTRK